MAHTLSITYGSTTIDLTLVDRTPKSAPASEPTVTGYWEVHISAATSELLVEEIHKINRAFEQARQRQDDPFLDRVYLNFLPKDLTDSQRSEILNGNIEFYDETLKYAWANNAVDLRLAIKRRNYWEGALTPIPLTNSNGTDVTSGLILYNCNDGDGSSPNIRENFADIDGADLKGDLPAPIKIKLVMPYIPNYEVFPIILINNRGDPTSIVHMIEGEDAMTSNTDADCSGGEYGYASWTTTIEAILISLNTSSFDSFEGGRWYLPFLRLQSIPTIADLWLRIYRGPLYPGTEWINYPATGGPQIIQFPPLRIGVPEINGMTIPGWVKVKTSTTGTKTLNVDYIGFIPFDGVRYYEFGYISLSDPYSIMIDDPYINQAYEIQYSSPYTEVPLLMHGTALEVVPNRNARVYLLLAGTTAKVSIGSTLQLWYRPRRLSL